MKQARHEECSRGGIRNEEPRRNFVRVSTHSSLIFVAFSVVKFMSSLAERFVILVALCWLECGGTICVRVLGVQFKNTTVCNVKDR